MGARRPARRPAVIGLVCRRTHALLGPHVLADVQRLGRRLRRHPRELHRAQPARAGQLTLGERELAAVTFGGGHPEVYGLLPAAVEAGTGSRLRSAASAWCPRRASAMCASSSSIRPVFSIAAGAATSCHDYPRPYDLAASAGVRRGQYTTRWPRSTGASFRPFSAARVADTGIDAGPGCLDWPADPTAGSPLQGQALPDVPVLVQSGDLDTNTPVEQGRDAAAQFAHPTSPSCATSATPPDTRARAAMAMALDLIRRLRTER